MVEALQVKVTAMEDIIKSKVSLLLEFMKMMCSLCPPTSCIHCGCERWYA